MNTLLGGGFKYFYFHPYLGKIYNLTNIFEMGWNHQPVLICLFIDILRKRFRVEKPKEQAAVLSPIRNVCFRFKFDGILFVEIKE